MANDLITRLILDNKQFDNNLAKATKEVQNFQNKMNSFGKIKDSFNSVLGVVSKFAPAIGVAVGSYETFNKVVNSSESTIDAWERTCEAAKSSVDAFFIALNTGSFSNFLGGLNNIVKGAKEAYDAIDDLGTLTSFQDVELAKLEAKKVALEIKIKLGINVDENQSQLQDIINEETTLASLKYEAATKAYLASIKRAVTEQTGGWYDEEIARKYSDWEYFQTLNKTELKQEEKELNNRKKALGSQYDLVVANYGKYKKMVEQGTASQKVIDSVELANEERKLQTKLAIVDLEGKITKANNYQLIAINAQTKALQSQKAELKYLEETESDLSDKANAFRNLLSGDFNISINGKNIIDDNFRNLIKELPDDIVAGLSDAFNKFTAQQEINNKLYADGALNTEEWQNKNTQNGESLLSNVQSIAEQSIITQGKKVNAETINPLLSLMLSWIATLAINSKSTASSKPVALSSLIDVYNSYENSSMEAMAINDPYQRYKALSSLKTNIEKDSQIALKQVEGAYLRVYDLVVTIFEQFKDDRETINKKLEELGFTDVENIKAPKDGVFDIGDSNPELNQLVDSLSNYSDLLEEIGRQAKVALNEMQHLKDVMNFSDVNQQFAQMGLAISNTLKAAGEDEAAFWSDTIALIANMMALYGNLALVEATASAASLPFPYNLAAAGIAVSTIAAIVSNAMSTFANGGIVSSGSYVGDHNLVRVNGGEMILNGSQLANLFRMLNGADFRQSSGESPTVHFRISGKDLVGTLNNYNSKYSKL